MSETPRGPGRPDYAGPGESNGGRDARDARDATAVLEDLEALRGRAEKAEQERTEFKDLLQRTQADFLNYQKRVQRDFQQELKFAHRGLANDLLTALDNLDRATAAARQAGETGPLVQGVVLVQAQILDVLRRHGVTRIEAQGQPFDPNVHEAVMQQPSAGQPAGTVLQVLEQGFQIHDRVLRPAKVIVAAPGGEAALAVRNS